MYNLVPFVLEIGPQQAALMYTYNAHQALHEERGHQCVHSEKNLTHTDAQHAGFHCLL